MTTTRKTDLSGPYHIAVNACCAAAGVGPEWNRKFRDALDAHGLELVPQMVLGERYPDGGCYQAPNPYTEHPGAWPTPMFIAYKPEAK